MLISKFRTIDQSRTITINDREVIHIISDYSLKTKDILSLAGINYSACMGIVVDKTFSVRGRTVNNSDYLFSLEKDKIKEKVYNIFPPQIPAKKFIIYDHTPLSSYLGTSGLSNKMLPFYLFENLKASYDKIRETDSTLIQNAILFLNSLDGFAEILPILNNIVSSKTAPDFKIFDHYVFICIVYDGDTLFFPIMDIDAKTGLPGMVKANIPKIDAVLRSLDKNKKKEDIETNTNTLDSKKINIKDINTDGDSSNINTDSNIDKKQYIDILKKYQIKDPSIAESIITSVNSYITSNDTPGIKKLTPEDIVLKAVNKTIFGHDKISDEYKQNPSKLLSKLEEFNTYSKPIIFAPLKHETMLQPQHIIKLDKITGPVRHEYEFGQNIDNNIRDLFKTLETKKYPVSILKINREDKDNNMDRFIEYTITMQNKKGGMKEKYDVKVRVPTLINKKYFKLNGKEYIMSTQQFLMPITKDKSNETRLITHYGMIRTKIVNLKFNISDIQKIIQYIMNRYPKLITSSRRTVDSYSEIVLDDGTTIKPYENNFMDGYVYNPDSNEVTKNGQSVLYGRNEIIYGKLLNLSRKENPAENFKSSRKTIDFLEIHMSGTKMPFIILYWQQLGLLDALHTLNITFSIGTSPLAAHEHMRESSFELKDGNFLFLYYDVGQKRQELIGNGLYTGYLPKYLKANISKTDLSVKDSISPYISDKYGKTRSRDFDRLVENMVDPVTTKLFTFKDQSTNVLDILKGPILDKLFNGEIDHRADLSTMRARQSEYLTHLLYNEVSMAYNKYVNDLDFDKDNAKLFFDEKYIIKNLMGQHEHSGNAGSIMDYVNPFSPVDEICKSTKVVKTGKGGVPTKRAFVKQQRNIHPSYYGNIAAYSTTESGDVGLII